MTSNLSTRPELRAFFARGYWQCRCGGYRLRKPDLAECPECHAMRPAGIKTQPAQAKTGIAVSVPVSGSSRNVSSPTKTELEYKRRYLQGRDARYEGVTFRMANGHRYTPDWVCQLADGQLVCIEVKGSYRLGSYQRALVAFASKSARVSNAA